MLLKNTVPKFEILQEMDSSPNQINSEWNNKSDTCIVYCCWSHVVYCYMMYYSILSQIKYTDALNCSLKVFLHTNLYKEIESDHKELFGFLKSLGDSVIVMDGDLSKYIIMNCTELSSFSKICLMDCDAFMFANNKSNHYELLIKDNVSMPIGFNPYGTLLHRKVISNFKQSDDQYIEYLSQLIRTPTQPLINFFKTEKKWRLGCWILYNPAILRSIDWQRIITGMSMIESGCDETVIQLYCFKKGIQIKDPSFKIVIGSIETCKESVTDEGVYCFHPFIGSEAKSNLVIQFLRELES